MRYTCRVRTEKRIVTFNGKMYLGPGETNWGQHKNETIHGSCPWATEAPNDEVANARWKEHLRRDHPSERYGPEKWREPVKL